MESIGQRLSTLRKSRKVKQQKLVDLLEISRRSYCYFEADQRPINLAQIIKLANFYGVSVDYLVGRIEPEIFELTDDKFLTNSSVFHVDGKPLTKEDLLSFITSVREKREISKE
ncbi:helix-turn-helix domain-containing protein [Brevibacillus sp. JB24b]|uniref:helix-turn-helix domain-containing protein n=1 Tax=Brevibacillus sp. JB24b TaxID=3422308 RepID=UPI003F683631